MTSGLAPAFRRHVEIHASSAASEHGDSAIGAFLDQIEADFRAGRNLQSLPKGLSRAMLAAGSGHAADLDEDIDGHMAL